MKKLWSIFTAAALIFSLCACSSSGLGSSSSNASDNPIYGTVDIPFQAQYIRTDGYREGATFPRVVIIRSVEELNAYYEQYRNIFDLERKAQLYSDTTIGFLDACDKYDESYFEGRILIMVLLEEGSGSTRHAVTDVTLTDDGRLYISIDTIVPEIGTCDMAEWHILIEPEAGVDVAGAEDVFLNGKP